MPNNTTDVAIYTLAGVFPIIRKIPKSALKTFNKICALESSVEKDIAIRQLTLVGFSTSN